MSAPRELVLVANARIPSERAQSLQVVQAAAAFARAGWSTTLLHARRRNTSVLPRGTDVFAHYDVPPGARPQIESIACIDWIDRVPRPLQYAPARWQELSFSRNAAREISERHRDAVVLSREIECARTLLLAGRRNVFVEVHRVPGGTVRTAWLREVGEHAAGVIAISGGVREDLLALGLDTNKITVEHDAFEATRFANIPTRAEARARLGVEARAKLVAYTGGLLEWKGVDVLVDAARKLDGVTFVIAGGMPADVERLRQRARGASNVRIDGFQAPGKVLDYLAAANIGVVPNRSQPAISARYTSPLKVFEAMAVGLPLVASDVPSLRELLNHDVDAWLVAPDDAHALAVGLRKLLDDDALLARLGARLRTRASEHTSDARARRLLAWIASKSL